MLQPYTLGPFMQLPDCNDINRWEFNSGDVLCSDIHKKIIILRAYFCLITLNFFFIIFTTAYFIYLTLLKRPLRRNSSSQEISKQWQLYSLKKRGLFGSVLGASGYLIFSTSVLFCQSFIIPLTCEIYLWGPLIGLYVWSYAIVWRALRLHTLIRINELQQRFLQPDFSERSKKNNVDYAWFIRHKDTLNTSTAKHITIFAATITVIIVVIVFSEVFGMRVEEESRCEFYIGNCLILVFTVFFFVTIIPFVLWYLRADGDAHGIRKELWVTMTVGIPCFIICAIWQIVFDVPDYSNPMGIRSAFGPSNWILIVCATSHAMSIALPAFKTLSTGKRRSSKDSLISTNHHGPSIISHRRVLNTSWTRYITFKSCFSTTTQQHIQKTARRKFELTTESLHYALSDPESIKLLQVWAVKDFTVENILFYEQYLSLVNQLENSIFKTGFEKKMGAPQHEKRTCSNKSEAAVPSNCPSQSVFVPDVEQIGPCETNVKVTPSIPNELLHTPFSIHLVPSLVRFYNTFIAENAPLQVNISHKAKNRIDVVLEPLSKKNQTAPVLTESCKIKPGIPSFLQNSFDSDEESTDSSICIIPTSTSSMSTGSPEPSPVSENHNEDTLDSFKNCQQANASTTNTRPMSAITTTNLTLGIFEQAREEVFWNIFSNVFPKFVEVFNEP